MIADLIMFIIEFFIYKFDSEKSEIDSLFNNFNVLFST